MTIQQNYPAIKPTLNLDFANTKQLDPRITYSRASTGTYYDGKTVAKAEENLLLQSQSFDNSYWSTIAGGYPTLNISVTANNILAPDGTTTGDTVIGNNTTSVKQIGKGYAFAPKVLSGPHTFSIYLKYINHQYVNIMVGNAAGPATDRTGFTLDVQSGIQTAENFGADISNISVVAAPNGWYRCAFTFTRAATDANIIISLVPTATGNSYGVSGTSSSTTADASVGVWGAQLEQRSFATAYTPTTTAPITNYIPVLQTASAGTPRFDHNPITGESLGLLIEEQRTNLLTYSSDFDNPAWTASALNMATTQANALVSPDGTLTADKIIPTTTNAVHRISQSVTVTATTHTYTVFAKSGEYTSLALQMYDNTAGTTRALSSFNLLTGVATPTVGTASITAVGNGWFRCTVVSAATHAAGATLCWVFPDTTSSFAGNGFSGIYIWGAQLETGAFATSYIPTALTYSGRASTGTFRGANGLLQTAAINAPRYEVNAGGGSNLLLEGASSNLLTYTEDFDDAYWQIKSNSVVVSNSSLSPNGTFTADKIVESTANGQHWVGVPGGGGTITGGVAYTLSVYVKQAERGYFALNGDAGNGRLGAIVVFNLINGTIAATGAGVTASISAAGNGWYRCIVTATASSTGTGYPYFGLRQNSDPFNAVYTGDGISGLFIWGAQFELGSAATSYIPSLETFTGRASTATYYDSTGVIRTAASGQPRYSYNPQLLSVAPKLLLETQGTNLLTFSEQFDNAIWSKTVATVTANAAVSPDGVADADKVIASSGSAQHFIFQNASIAANGTYTTSFYAKSSEYTSFDLWLLNAATADRAVANFNLSAGTTTNGTAGGAAFTGQSSTITPVGNGWYRCTLTATTTGGAINLQSRLFPSSSATYTGDGTSGLFIWGAQLETGSGATSYIPTVASQVTRVADTSTSAAQSRAADVYSSSQVTRAVDNAVMTGANFSSWYNQSQGTVYVEANSNRPSGNFLSLVDIGVSSSTTNRNTLSINNNFISAASITNGVAGLVAETVNMRTAGVAFKGAYSAKENSILSCLNGGVVATDISGSFLKTVDNMKLGVRNDFGVPLNGWISKVSYYPIAVTSTQIQALTT